MIYVSDADPPPNGEYRDSDGRRYVVGKRLSSSFRCRAGRVLICEVRNTAPGFCQAHHCTQPQTQNRPPVPISTIPPISCGTAWRDVSVFGNSSCGLGLVDGPWLQWMVSGGQVSAWTASSTRFHEFRELEAQRHGS